MRVTLETSCHRCKQLSPKCLGGSLAEALSRLERQGWRKIGRDYLCGKCLTEPERAG